MIDSCKLKEDPDLRDRKEAFLQRLEARMSNSEAMKVSAICLYNIHITKCTMYIVHYMLLF